MRDEIMEIEDVKRGNLHGPFVVNDIIRFAIAAFQVQLNVIVVPAFDERINTSETPPAFHFPQHIAKWSVIVAAGDLKLPSATCNLWTRRCLKFLFFSLLLI